MRRSALFQSHVVCPSPVQGRGRVIVAPEKFYSLQLSDLWKLFKDFEPYNIKETSKNYLLLASIILFLIFENVRSLPKTTANLKMKSNLSNFNQPFRGEISRKAFQKHWIKWNPRPIFVNCRIVRIIWIVTSDELWLSPSYQNLCFFPNGELFL